MKKTDIITLTDSQFDVVNELPEYYVKNNHFGQRTDKLSDLGNDAIGVESLVLNATKKILTIIPPTEIINPIVLSLGKHEV